MTKKLSLIILGSGNVAFHLAPALYQAGYRVLQVFSRNKETGSELANKIESQYIDRLEKLDALADVILCFLPNEGINEVIQHWPKNYPSKVLVLHSSGSYQTRKLAEISKHFGVFYPLQTFKKGVALALNKTPFLLHTNDEDTYTLVEELAGAISPLIYPFSDEERSKIHLAAVFINNFTNALFTAAYEYLDTEGINKEPLKPIIEKTFKNLEKKNPATIQTGPAIRKETALLAKQLELLKDYPEHQAIYKSLSNYIQKQAR